jgi:hypothetical protein
MFMSCAFAVSFIRDPCFVGTVEGKCPEILPKILTSMK